VTLLDLSRDLGAAGSEHGQRSRGGQHGKKRVCLDGDVMVRTHHERSAALFLLVDGAMKLVKPEPVVKATVELGYPESVIFPPGSSCSLAPSSI
jgi:hypothetical protein